MDIKTLKSNILFRSPFVLKKNKTMLFVLSGANAEGVQDAWGEFVTFDVKNFL